MGDINQDGAVNFSDAGAWTNAVQMGSTTLPPRPDPAARSAFRQRLGVGAETPLLGSFGFQTPIKRTRVAVRALAREELADAHLVVAGEVLPILDLESDARAVPTGPANRAPDFIAT